MKLVPRITANLDMDVYYSGSSEEHEKRVESTLEAVEAQRLQQPPPPCLSAVTPPPPRQPANDQRGHPQYPQPPPPATDPDDGHDDGRGGADGGDDNGLDIDPLQHDVKKQAALDVDFEGHQ